MIIRFKDLKDFFEYNKDDPIVTRKNVAKELGIEVSFLSKLVNKKGYACLAIAELMEELYNIPKESIMKPTRAKKKESIFKKILRRKK